MLQYCNVILWLYLWAVGLGKETALAFQARPHYYGSVFKSGAVQLGSISVSSSLTTAVQRLVGVDLLSVWVVNSTADQVQTD